MGVHKSIHKKQSFCGNRAAIGAFFKTRRRVSHEYNYHRFDISSNRIGSHYQYESRKKAREILLRLRLLELPDVRQVSF